MVRSKITFEEYAERMDVAGRIARAVASHVRLNADKISITYTPTAPSVFRRYANGTYTANVPVDHAPRRGVRVKGGRRDG